MYEIILILLIYIYFLIDPRKNALPFWRERFSFFQDLSLSMILSMKEELLPR